MVYDFWLLEANTNPVQAHDERAGDCGLIGDIARVAKAEGLDGLLEALVSELFSLCSISMIERTELSTGRNCDQSVFTR